MLMLRNRLEDVMCYVYVTLLYTLCVGVKNVVAPNVPFYNDFFVSGCNKHSFPYTIQDRI